METNDRVEAAVRSFREKFAVEYHDEMGDYLYKAFTTHEREAVEAERKEWLSGNRCGLCGGSNLDSKDLSDVCGKCFEEQ